MPKKLTPEIKEAYTFMWAKSRGLNNREAGRFYDLFKNREDTELTCSDAIENYLQLCKEPKINQNALKDDAGIVTRSKLVMAYERHRRAFLTIAGLKNSTQRNKFETVLSKLNVMEVGLHPEGRAFVLNVFNEAITNESK
jgi:hypothetical protein